MAESKSQPKKDLTQEIEEFLDQVTTHPLFLNGVSSLLNFNSYRKILIKKTMQQIWRSLELPNKQDQEKTLYLVSELQFKIQKLEKQLAQARAQAANSTSEETTPNSSSKTGKAVLTALQ